MDIKEFKELIEETGGIDSFTTDQAFKVMQMFFGLVQKEGLNVNDSGNISAVFESMFKMEFYNLPNLENGKFILTPNHTSEFDGPIWGVRHRNMLVVAKKEWTDDRLVKVLGQFFKIFGVDRNDNASKVNCLKACIKHLKENENGIVTIFPQQTIADINNCGPEDIASGPYFIYKKTNALIIPVFCEQPAFGQTTRIVYGEPMKMDDGQDFNKAWLEEVLKLQNSLNPNARRPALNPRHSIPISKRGF